MKKLVYDFKQLTFYHRGGSEKTQRNRLNMVILFATQLTEQIVDGNGRPRWKDLRAWQLKGRHVNALVTLWKAQGIEPRTMANRLAVLRWICRHLERQGVIHKSNADYGLAPRQSVAQISKAKTLPDGILEQIRDPYVRFSVELQAQFGLRREEAILIRVWWADRGDHLFLKDTWCKGKRARAIPIETPQQRDLLERIKDFLPGKESALIPPHLKLHQQVNRYTYYTKDVDLTKLHGLRHGYVHMRLEEEAGHAAPVAGGPHRKDMTKEQRAQDTAARLTVSRELGHSRINIIGTYAGT